MRSYFFALQFTLKAEDFMREHHIFCSTRSDLDALLALAGLRALLKVNDE